MDCRLSPNLRRLSAGLLLGTCLSPCPVWAVDFIVSNNADSGAGSLRQAIIDLNTTGGASNNIIVNSGVGTITLTSGDLQTVARNVTVVGNNNTLSGNNQFRGLFIGAFTGTTQTAVSVSIADLTITNARAAGGNGGERGGGGGAGLGGALFVADQASLTVSNVSLTGNAATGGAGGPISGANGGGGGMGGAGGAGAGNARAGGGGLGAGASGGDGTASGSAGIATGAASGGAGQSNPGSGGASGGGGGGGANIVDDSGGGGGVGGTNATTNVGGSGGFGGGGGGGLTTGGAGGFGGGGGPGGTGGGGGFGGGGGASATTAGAGGFGGGNGGAAGVGGGGGGAGLGGAVFVQQGGTLNVAGAFSVNGSSATGGAGVGQGTAGSAFGSGMFLQGNGTVNFTPGSGVTQTISNVIADQTGSGGTGGNAGAGAIAKSGAGTLALSAANTYSGGTTVTGGLVNFAAGSLGSGNITLNGGGLQWATGNTTDISGQLAALGAGGGTFDTNGNNVSFATALSGGALTKTGAGTMTLTNTNGYTGATTINAGTLALSGSGSVSTSSAVTVNVGATFDISGTIGTSAIRTLGGGGTVQLGSNGLAITNATTLFGGVIAGTGGLEIVGGTLGLSGVNTYSNATQIDQGATLVLLGNGSIANSAFVGFAPLVAGAATLDISGTTSGTSVAGLFSLGGIGVVSLGSKILTITNGSSFSGVLQDGGISGGTGGALVITGGATQELSGINTYTGATTIGANSTLSLSNAGSIAASSGVNLAGAFATFDISLGTGDKTIQGLSGVAGSSVLLGNNNLTVGSAASTSFAGVIDGSGGTGGLIKVGSGTLTLSGANTYTGGTTVSQGVLAGTTTSLQGNILNNANVTFDQASTGTYGGVMSGTGNLTKTGTGTLVLTGNNLYSGGTTINGGLINFAAGNNLGTGTITLNGGGLQWATGNTTDISSRLAPLGAGGATFDTNGNAVRFATGLTGSGGLTKTGGGALFLLANNTYTGGTTVNGGILHIGAEGGPAGSIVGTVTVNGDDSHIAFLSTSSAGNLAITLNGGTGHFFGNSTGANATITANSASTWFIENSGSGGQARFIVNAGGAFDISPLAISGTTAGSIEGAGGVRLGSKQLTVGGNNLSTTVSGVIADGGRNAGTGGSLVKVGTGTLTLSGANTFTGGTTVNAGGLVVNGSLASTVTLNDGLLGGSGTIGGLVANGGMLAPGNSIGTLTVSGTFTQNGGTYVVEANPQGQSDRVNVSGTATINGGTVQLVAAPGNYGIGTTYTILNATGGVSGAYSGVSSNFAFLTPSLTYNANNVFLTLALQGNAFSGFGGNTVNQRNVGYALDQSFANATGDFATVIGALAGLSTAQAPAALNAISGQPYADFGTTNVANASLFMNTLGQQMALARSGSAPGARVALAQACAVEACDEARPLSAWFSGLGGLGSVQGDGNSSTLTYNVGGAAAGIDYRLDSRFLVGLGVGYTHGTEWVNSFMGQGWTDSVSVAAYGSFTPMGPLAGFYADALVGYAYLNNQLQRQIQIAGLQQRTASGSTGANQFLAQVETGYKLGVWTMGSLTPFARFQTSITSQNAFTESGASSLNLNVAQQTTNSVRTVLGAELGSSIPLGTERVLGLSLRLGWQHEYAYTGRPISASFGGAPSASFTVYGATPTRDAAIVGFSAMTNVATATQLYLRYDGELASGTDNHALTAGLRMSW